MPTRPACAEALKIRISLALPKSLARTPRGLSGITSPNRGTVYVMICTQQAPTPLDAQRLIARRTRLCGGSLLQDGTNARASKDIDTDVVTLLYDRV